MEGGDEKERAPTEEGVDPTATIVIDVVIDEASCSVFDRVKDTVGRKKVKEGTMEVDFESGGEFPELDGEKSCRICHLNSAMVGSLEEGWELIEIGCGCKGELGIAHRRCAEAWFRVKGNRICEICGLNAKSIVGKEDISFMEAWHEGRRRPVGNNQNSGNEGAYWTSQRFCSFLVSFLVIAFILQWYLRESFD